jgi:hypothetical protein
MVHLLNWDRASGIVANLGDPGFEFWQSQEIFWKCPDRLCCLLCKNTVFFFQSKAVREWSRILTFISEPRSRMRGAIPRLVLYAFVAWIGTNLPSYLYGAHVASFEYRSYSFWSIIFALSGLMTAARQAMLPKKTLLIWDVTYVGAGKYQRLLKITTHPNNSQ